MFRFVFFISNEVFLVNLKRKKNIIDIMPATEAEVSVVFLYRYFCLCVRLFRQVPLFLKVPSMFNVI